MLARSLVAIQRYHPHPARASGGRLRNAHRKMDEMQADDLRRRLRAGVDCATSPAHGTPYRQFASRSRHHNCRCRRGGCEWRHERVSSTRIGHLLGSKSTTPVIMESPEGGRHPPAEGHPFLRLTARAAERARRHRGAGNHVHRSVVGCCPADARGSKIKWSRCEPGQIRRHPHRGHVGDHGKRLQNLTRQAFSALR